MSDIYGVEGGTFPQGPRGMAGQPPIIINNHPPKTPWLSRTFSRFLLTISILANIAGLLLITSYFQGIFKQQQYVSGPVTARQKVAIIDVSGMIMNETVKDPIKEFEDAAKDSAIKGVILRLNSPGGEVFSTDRLYRAIIEYKKSEKPVVVLMESVAASGAFWAAMPGDKIYAAENTITGSVGVLLQTFVLTGLLKEWGIEPVTLKTGPLKDTGSLFREVNDKDREELGKLMNGWYEQFIAVVNKHRGEKAGGETKIREFADGRVVLGPEAKSLGFVDEIGYLDDAVEAVKSLAGVTDKVQIIKYQRQTGIAQLFSAEKEAPFFSRQTLTELQAPKILALPPSFMAAGWGEKAKE